MPAMANSVNAVPARTRCRYGSPAGLADRRHCGTGLQRRAGRARAEPRPVRIDGAAAARRAAPDGYYPSEDRRLEQPGALPSIGVNPHRPAGDTIAPPAGHRPATDDEARK